MQNKLNLNKFIKTSHPIAKEIIGEREYDPTVHVMYHRGQAITVQESDLTNEVLIGADARVADREKRIKNLNKEIVEIDAEIKRKNDSITAFNKTSAEIKTNTPSSTKYVDLLNELAKHKELNDKYTTEISTLDSNIEELTNQRNQINWLPNLSNNKKEFNEQLEDWNKYNAAKSKLLNANDEFTAACENYQDAKGTLDSQAEDIDFFEQNARDKQADLDKLLKEMVALDNAINTAENSEEMKALSSRIATLQDDIAANAKIINEASNTIAATKVRLETAQNTLTKAENKLSKLKDDENLLKPIYTKYLDLYKEDPVKPESQVLKVDSSKLETRFAPKIKLVKVSGVNSEELKTQWAKTINSTLPQLAKLVQDDLDFDFESEMYAINQEIKELSEDVGKELNLLGLEGVAEEISKQTAEIIAENTESAKILEKTSESHHAEQDLKIFVNYNRKSGEKYATYSEISVGNDHAMELLQEVSEMIKARSNEAKSEEEIKKEIKEMIDPRNWFRFKFQYEKDGSARADLTEDVYSNWSVGEKGRALLEPTFIAMKMTIENHFSEDAPSVLFMDEAFTGIDEDQTRILINKLAATFNTIVATGYDLKIPSKGIDVTDITYAHVTKTTSGTTVKIMPRLTERIKVIKVA